MMVPMLYAVPDDKLLDLLGLMALARARSLVVVDNDRVIGIVSDYDVLAHAVPTGEGDFILPEDLTAATVMQQLTQCSA